MKAIAIVGYLHGSNLSWDWKASWKQVWQSYRWNIWDGMSEIDSFIDIGDVYGHEWQDVLLQVLHGR